MSLIEEALRRMQEPLLNLPSTQERTPKARRPAGAPEPAPVHPWPVAPPAPGGSLEALRTGNPLLPTTLAVVILTVAMVVGGAVWFGQTLTRPQAAPSTAARRPSAPTVPRSAASPAPLEETAADADAPAIPAPSAEEAFTLTGVVEGVGEPYAVINGAIVAVGERVGHATLLAVANGAVQLRLDTGEERVLRVPR
jgi:hypothetical protein